VYETKIGQETVSGSLREGVVGRRENSILRSYIFALFTFLGRTNKGYDLLSI
jgi:hypothetical protein